MHTMVAAVPGETCVHVSLPESGDWARRQGTVARLWPWPRRNVTAWHSSRGSQGITHVPPSTPPSHHEAFLFLCHVLLKKRRRSHTEKDVDIW